MGPGTNFICIKDAPLAWTAGVVRGMFSQYGPVEEVTISPTLNGTFNYVIVEFESEEDAEAAVDDHRNSDFKVTFHRPVDHDDSATFLVIEETRGSEEAEATPTWDAVECSNPKCTHQVVVEKLGGSGHNSFDKHQNIYCSKACFNEFLDMKGRINIYDKWLASLGNSGTGMLKEHLTIDNLKITVDSEGSRLVDVIQMSSVQ